MPPLVDIGRQEFKRSHLYLLRSTSLVMVAFLLFCKLDGDIGVGEAPLRATLFYSVSQLLVHE